MKRFTNREVKLLEVFTKGYASKRRILLLSLVAKYPQQTVEFLASTARIGYQSAAQHLQHLERTGLLTKQYDGFTVQHSITKRGTLVLKQLRQLLKT